MYTISEKWAKHFPDAKVSHVTSDFLEALFPVHLTDDNILINGGVLPTKSLKLLIENLEVNEALMLSGELIAARLPLWQFERLLNDDELDDLAGYEMEGEEITQVQHLTDILALNKNEILKDISLISNKNTLPSNGYMIKGDHPVIIGDHVDVSHAYFNTEDGPVYLDDGVVVMEGASIRGPAAFGSGTVVKMGAKVYGGSIGPFCVVGGEIKNCVFMGFSNKGHEGYLGDSVIGSWCNLGALTSNSNLKNNFSTIKLWDYTTQSMLDSGKQKCGLFMGDYSRTAIHTMFNSGTVVGVSSHVYGTGFQPKFIPSFSWGEVHTRYHLEKAIHAAEVLHSFKSVPFSEHHKLLFENLFDRTQKYTSA